MRSAVFQNRGAAVAIVGLAGRFPGARNVAQYWQNLCAGVESLELASEEELLAAGVPATLLSNPAYVRSGGSIADADTFDASFFGFGAREAEIIDPQQRVFLECAWEALEDAGCDPRHYAGAIGVFAGSGMNTYGPINLLSNPQFVESVGPYQVMLGNDKDFLATRVAYKLNLRGPAISVQTACSTSLVAVQMAFESLLRGECDMALAGGVSIQFPQNGGYLYMPGMILSPDGHCRAFDADAAGTVPGRGAGIVVLKLLEDAVRDDDRIYAVIHGAAINNDGASKVGYSAPSVEGQSNAIRKSIEMSGFAPESIRYVEAHGTGTEVGDPIEVAALTEAFGECTGARQFCALGSVKPNIGHLDTAAGVAGLIKAALSLHHRMIPPTLHFRRPNPHIDFAQTPFYVNAKLTPYEGAEPFRAGVSSFGIGGTNAHVTLEEWRGPVVTSDTSSQLIVLSARSSAALEAQCGALAHHLAQNPSASFAETAYTLQAGRRHFPHRRFLVARDAESLQHRLETPAKSGAQDAITEQQDPGVAFLFPGQGSQYINMGLGLYQGSGTFRAMVDRCSTILEPQLGLDLRSILYPQQGSEEEAQELLNQTWITQPALFTIEYAAACLWRSLGIEPAAMVGHSVGEYVAACLAGVFELEDALKLIATRGKLIQALPSGAMLSVPLPESEVTPLLPEGLSIAAVNSRKNTVVSGPADLVDAFETSLRARNITGRRLRTSHAFHSAMMEPALNAFREQVASVSLTAPSLPYLSNLTGTWITDSEATDPGYWVRHLRHAVRYADCIDQLSDSAASVWLEAGPGETLITLIRDHLGREAAAVTIASMRHPLAQKDDREHWLEAVGKVWQAGIAPRWQALYEAGRPRKTSLPTYPFERQRFWIEARTLAQTIAAEPESKLSKNPDIASWFYLPSWQRSQPAPKPQRPRLSQDKVCLLFLDAEVSATEAIAQAAAHSGQVIRIERGPAFAKISDDLYQINPTERADYATLFSTLLSDGLWPERIVHAYALGAAFHLSLDSSLDNGFFSLMYLVQTIGDVSSTRAVELNVLTSSGCDIFGNGNCDPRAAALSGFCRVLPIESANIRCRVIDLDDQSNAVSPELLTQQLVSELDLEPEMPLVAWRGRGRWVPGYEQVSIPASLPSGIDIPRHAVFLITGGLGGIGLVWACYLASTYQARFVLTSRSAFPEPDLWPLLLQSDSTSEALRQRLYAIGQICELGGEVAVVTADATVPEQMQRAVETAHNQFGSLFGILHAAGIPGVGMLQGKSRADAISVLAPKLHGTEWLTPLLNQRGLGLVMLCSSISGIVPGIGLTDYAAANVYLDAFAGAHDNPTGTRVLSHDWDTWSNTGMAFDLTQRLISAELRAQVLIDGITDLEAEEVFPRLLSYPQPQLIVSTRNLQKLLKQAQAKDLHVEATSKMSSGTLHPRPALSSEYSEPTDETEEALVAIWQDLLGVDPIGTDDNFFQLGGHSLLGTQMMARIRERFGIDLPLRTVFEAPTPAQMASLIRTIPWASGSAGTAPTLDMEREEIEL